MHCDSPVTRNETTTKLQWSVSRGASKIEIDDINQSCEIHRFSLLFFWTYQCWCKRIIRTRNVWISRLWGKEGLPEFFNLLERLIKLNHTCICFWACGIFFYRKSFLCHCWMFCRIIVFRIYVGKFFLSLCSREREGEIVTRIILIKHMWSFARHHCQDMSVQ